jgi:hypothetical protein
MSARVSRTPRFWGIRLNPFAFISFRRRRRMAGLFAPRRPRAPLLRLVMGLLGLALLAVLLVFGLLIGAVMLGIGLAWRSWRRRSHGVAAVSPSSIDGEYRIVRKRTLPSPIASASMTSTR